MVYNIARRNLLFVLSVAWNCGSVWFKFHCSFSAPYELKEPTRGSTVVSLSCSDDFIPDASLTTFRDSITVGIFMRQLMLHQTVCTTEIVQKS
jgi:hypothetical protein